MDKEAKLSEYIKNEIMRNRYAELDKNKDLVSAGILDSLRILQLVAYIEEKFDIDIPDEAVVYENFHSLQAIIDYLNSIELF